MPCSDSSSSMVIQLDHEEKFVGFEYAKITCGREITGSTGLNEYFKGWELSRIIDCPYNQICTALDVQEEENQYILYLEWDVLRAGLALYLGIDDPHIDTDRCLITSIEHADKGIEIAQVVLPPKEMPKILPCSLGDTDPNQ